MIQTRTGYTRLTRWECFKLAFSLARMPREMRAIAVVNVLRGNGRK